MLFYAKLQVDYGILITVFVARAAPNFHKSIFKIKGTGLRVLYAG